MAKRKYEKFLLELELDNAIETNNYKDIFKEYQSYKYAATLYGIDSQGEISIIMSKANKKGY